MIRTIAIMLLSAGAASAQVLVELPNSTGGPAAVSPDGDHVTYFNGTQCVVLELATMTQEVTNLFDANSCEDIVEDWNSDGHLVLVNHLAIGDESRNGLFQVPFVLGSPPSYSPDYIGFGYEMAHTQANPIQIYSVGIQETSNNGAVFEAWFQNPAGARTISPTVFGNVENTMQFNTVTQSGRWAAGMYYDHNVSNFRSVFFDGQDVNDDAISLPGIQTFGFTAVNAMVDDATHGFVAVGESDQLREVAEGVFQTNRTGAIWVGINDYAEPLWLMNLGGWDSGCRAVPKALNATKTVVVGESCGEPVAWEKPSGVWGTTFNAPTSLQLYLETIGEDLTGWDLRDALDVALDDYVVVGTGTKDGVPRNWVLTPTHQYVPEPGSMLMVSTGILGLAFLRRLKYGAAAVAMAASPAAADSPDPADVAAVTDAMHHAEYCTRYMGDAKDEAKCLSEALQEFQAELDAIEKDRKAEE